MLKINKALKDKGWRKVKKRNKGTIIYTTIRNQERTGKQLSDSFVET